MVFRVGQPSAESAAGPGTRDQPILAKRAVEGLLGSLQGRLTPTQGRALSSLAHEGDAELFGESLLDVARRVQRSGNLESAFLIYRWFESEECPSLPRLQARARRELDAIEGRGEGGARAEFLIGRFFQEASNPASIFAMGAAGALFRVTRLTSLARLTAGSEGGLLSGGFGARAASSLLGFAAEASAFPFLHWAGDAALGRSHPWDVKQAGAEVASSFLTLGALRLCGWGAGAAFRRAQGLSRGLAPSFSQQAFQQAGMFGGILMGHGLETMVGLRQRQEGATSVVDALSLLFQFNVAGDLTRRAFGQRFYHWERGLDFLAEASQQQQQLAPTAFGPTVLAMAAGSSSAAVVLSPHSDFDTGLLNKISGQAGEVGENRIDKMLGQIEAKIRAPGYLEGTREELLEKRVNSDLVDQAWLHQALEVLHRVPGIQTRILDDSVLLDHLAADQSAPDPTLVVQARRLLEGRGGEGSVARRVIEVRHNNEVAESESILPLADLMEWLSFLTTSQTALGNRVHFVNEAGNPDYVARIVMPSYMESLLRAVHGDQAMQFHYVDGAIPRDDVMRLRGQRVAPVGVARDPTYLQDTKGKVSPFGFLFHDAFFHAPNDSFNLGTFPEASALLYDLLRRREVNPGEGILDSLAELAAWVNEDGRPSLFGKILPALVHEILSSVRRERDSFLQEQDLEDIHFLVQALEQIAERLPEPGQRNEAETEFVKQVEDLGRALGIDLSPPILTYPPEIEAAWQRVETRWNDPVYYDGSRAELLSRRPDLDDVDAIWIHQAKDYVHRRGAEPEVFDVEELRNERDSQGRPLFDPTFFDRVMAILGERGREGAIARQVVRARFNKRVMDMADMESPFLRHLYLAPMMDDVSLFAKSQINLSDYSEDGSQKIDFVSLSLTEAIYQAIAGNQAAQFHFVPGTISRDRTMALRADRVSPVGLGRGLLDLGDLGFEVHPFCFTGHDAMFHAARDSEQVDPFPEVGGWLYRALDRRMPPGELREETLDHLTDSNLGGPRGTWDSFAEETLQPLRSTLHDAQAQPSFEARQAILDSTEPLLEAFRGILGGEAATHPHFSRGAGRFLGHIDLYSRRIERLKKIADVYQAAGVAVPPIFYDMPVLDAIERIEAKFQRPDYLQGSREELKRKSVELADADRLWYAQVRDLTRLVPGLEFRMADLSILASPAVGRVDHPTQDGNLWAEAFARLDRKATPFSEEAWKVSILEVPRDVSAIYASPDFLRFDPLLNDLEAHLDYRVQFIEHEGEVRRYRIPSLALLESLLEAAYGEDRVQFHFVPGEISRDDTARLRGMRVSPIGLSFSPVYSRQHQGPVHSFSYAQHDAFDHASRDARLSPGIPEAMHWLYREVQAGLPDLPARERLLEELSDLDLPAASENPWQNLSHRLSWSAHHAEGSDSAFREYLKSLEGFVRSRFSDHPDLARHRTRFLLDLVFVRSQGRNYRGAGSMK